MEAAVEVAERQAGAELIGKSRGLFGMVVSVSRDK